MIESIFDPPHFATDEEMHQLYSYESREDFLSNGPTTHDNRILYLWELYQLRGDKAGMAAQEARLNDPHYLDEIKYRDTFVDIKTLGILEKTS